MTRDEDAPDPILFDRRIVERNIKRGLITRKDYEQVLEVAVRRLRQAEIARRGRRREPESCWKRNPRLTPQLEIAGWAA